MSQVLPRYTKEWLLEKRVLCYRFEDMTMHTVDQWATDLSGELNNWPSNRPWRLILDIRLHGNIVNTYALRRAREISRLRPELPGRLAVLVASRLAADIITIAIRAANNSYRKRAVFVNEPLALHWLVDERDSR